MTANTRAKVAELRAVADQIVTPEVQQAVDVLLDHETARRIALRDLYHEFESTTGCSRPTAKRYVTRALRRRRGELVKERERGGPRPGAGAPPGNDNRWKSKR